MNAREYLKGLNEHDPVWDTAESDEYTEDQLINFAERYHEKQLKLLGIADVMLRFSSIEDDSAKALVIDYYAVKWLNDNGYYKDGKLNEEYGTAPILTAVKWAERQLNTVDAELLLNLLEKRVTQ